MIPLEAAIKYAPVLIADNDPASLMVLEKILLDTGHSNIMTTSDLREVRPLYHRWNFDLVVVDVLMPTHGAFQVMTDIQELIHEEGLSVIAIVNREERREDRPKNPAARRNLLKQGVSEFVFKPFEQKECLNRIHAILENKILFARQQTTATGVSAEAL